MNILIDGMGGDYAPQEIVKGAISAARKIEDTITIIGAQELISTELERRGGGFYKSAREVNCHKNLRCSIFSSDEAEISRARAHTYSMQQALAKLLFCFA